MLSKSAWYRSWTSTKSYFANCTRKLDLQTNGLRAAFVAAILALSSAALLADPSAISWSSPDGLVSIVKTAAGKIEIGIDRDHVRQDAVTIGVSQNQRYIIREELIEVRKGLDRKDAFDGVGGFVDPIVIRKDFRNVAHEQIVNDDEVVTVYTDNDNNWLVVITTYIKVESAQDHPATSKDM